MKKLSEKQKSFFTKCDAPNYIIAIDYFSDEFVHVEVVSRHLNYRVSKQTIVDSIEI